MCEIVWIMVNHPSAGSIVKTHKNLFRQLFSIKNTSPWYCYEIAEQNFLQKVKLSNLLSKLLVKQRISYRISRQKKFRFCKVCWIFYLWFINEMERRMIEIDVFEKPHFEGSSEIFGSKVELFDTSFSNGSSQAPHSSPVQKLSTLHLSRLFKNDGN